MVLVIIIKECCDGLRECLVGARSSLQLTNSAIVSYFCFLLNGFNPDEEDNDGVEEAMEDD